MPRYRLTLEYAGTRYSGWQIQKNARTVQGELHRALARGARRVRGSRPTDPAAPTPASTRSAQVVHLDLPSTLPPATLVARVNDALPADINVLDAERVPPRFHARHSAVARSYLYQIARRRTAFAKPFVWWVRDPLDLDAHAARGRALTGVRRLSRVHRRRPGGEVDEGARRRHRDRRRAATWSSSASSARTFSGRWCGACRRAGRSRARRPRPGRGRRDSSRATRRCPPG